MPCRAGSLQPIASKLPRAAAAPERRFPSRPLFLSHVRMKRRLAPVRAVRRAAAYAPALVLALLAACGTAPKVGPGNVSRLPPGNAQRDGPEANPPSNLEAVPDAVPQIEPMRVGGPNKPYEVDGHTYVPITDGRAIKEKGLASWYGKKFHGHRTSSGEAYNMYAMTAAHKTLPIPSYARVRNTANGREVIVRVNDRGPFSANRVIDLSYTAALKLGVLGGVQEVEVERITDEDIRTGAAFRKGGTQLAGGTGTAPVPVPVVPVVPPAAALAPAPAPVSAPAPPSTTVASMTAGTAAAGAGAATAGIAAATGAVTLPSLPVAGTSSGASSGAEAPAAPGSVPGAAGAAVATTGPGPGTPGSLNAAAAAGASGAAPGVVAMAGPGMAGAGSAGDAASRPPLREERGHAETAAGAGFWVQIGAYRQREGALDFQHRLIDEQPWLAPLLAVFSDKGMNRLQAGPYRTRDDARDAAERIRLALQLVPTIVEKR
jgi:rare lipoprotein A